MHLKTRPGVRQPFWLYLPQKPVAVAIYFRGTNGLSGVPDIEDALPRNGVGIAIVDPPSDLRAGFSRGERSGRDHVTDLTAVIRYLRQEIRVPIWLMGMSMGSVSAANVALNSAASTDGMVFMAPVTAFYWGRNAFGEQLVTSFPLEKLTVPVLAVAHRQDDCTLTPPRGAEEIVRRAARAGARGQVVRRRLPISNDPCLGNSHHTFAGIRPEVGEHIARFIVKHSRSR